MDSRNVRLAMAPISWTNDDMPDLGADVTFEQCVSEIALAGYSGTEVGTKYPKDPSVLKPMLDMRGISICNQWFSSFLLARSFSEVEAAFRSQLEFLRAMGASVIGPSEQSDTIQRSRIPILGSGKPVWTKEQWETVTGGLNRLGHIAREEGFRMCYHHHMGTGVQTVAETERLLDATTPGEVYLLFDTGHFALEGEDPVAALKKFASRVGHVHLKDVRPAAAKKAKESGLCFLDAVREGVFTVPGDGSIDFPSVFRILGENDYKGWLVVEAEQDPAKANPFFYAKSARAYIRKHAGI